MKKLLIPIAVLAVVVGALVLALSFKTSFAETIVRQCADAQNRANCYEREVPRLYPAHSIAQIFEIIQEIRTQDPSYQFCHVLAHKLGEEVVAHDPDRWLEAIPLNPPNGTCSNGFIHGVVGGRFRAEVLDEQTITKLIPDFARACAPRTGWDPSDLDRAICYHGMGHLFDFITDGDLDHALTICTRITEEGNEAFERVCIEGVFMQIYQPLEPDDFALIAKIPVTLTPETVPGFCAGFGKPEYVGACMQESLALSWDKLYDAPWVERFCAALPDATETSRCFEAAFSLAGRMGLATPGRMEQLCAALTADYQERCYQYGARVILEEDHSAAAAAVSFCARAATHAAACMQFLADMAPFIYGEDVRARSPLCAALPPEPRASCTAGGRQPIEPWSSHLNK